METYNAPTVIEYGDVREITAATHLAFDFDGSLFRGDPEEEAS